MAPQTLRHSTARLTSDLKAALASFQDEAVAFELRQALHDDKKLPDKEIAAAASEALNLLGQVEQILEPGHLVLADHFFGYTNTKCLCAAVELGVPDVLAEGPKTLEKLAGRCEARPDRLKQTLKTLYNNNIFSFDPASRLYSNNHVSELLRSDHWTQWYNWVNLYGNQFYDIARGIPGSVKKGAVRWGAQINYDTDDDMFTYFQSQGWVPQLHRTLGGGATAMADGILTDYPWKEVADCTVMDIGGGGGGFIASLLRANETMRGGVYDLPSVIDHATAFFKPGGQYADLEQRVPRANLIGGDFLEVVPPFEAYTMKWVLHDWKDEDSLRILKNVRKAIITGARSRLIVLESVLSDGRAARLSRYGDINMMMTANGQERTEKQWRELAKESGWNVTGIFHLRNAWVQAIELKP